MLRQRLNEKYSFVHPENPGINRLSHMLWTGAPTHPEADARNAVFYGDKAIDRTPCGTGTSARMAQLHAKGRLKVGDDFVHESIIGSLFNGRVEARGRASPASRPSSPRSAAGRDRPASTPSSSTTAIRSRTASSSSSGHARHVWIVSKSRRRRNLLRTGGASFEYSSTFGLA